MNYLLSGANMSMLHQTLLLTLKNAIVKPHFPTNIHHYQLENNCSTTITIHYYGFLYIFVTIHDNKGNYYHYYPLLLLYVTIHHIFVTPKATSRASHLDPHLGHRAPLWSVATQPSAPDGSCNGSDGQRGTTGVVNKKSDPNRTWTFTIHRYS